MRTNYYDLYVQDVMALAKTIVIKSEYSADRLNAYCTMFHGADSYDSNNPWTWKYYLNLSGQYHPVDEKMYITSLDTMQDIEFNKNNLSAHPATKAAYQYDSRYYRELVLKYPNAEQLILGIIYPVDIDDAIAAPDFSVISYPPHLIEEGEVSLVEKINEWLENYNVRWNNRAFNITDAYHPAAVLSVMYAQLVPLIITLRLRACKTDEAHSYHIREYLASHSYLDTYINQMTRKQQLFFYRNIRYIQRNPGKIDTFLWLMEKVMTDRNLPLSEYSMKHDVSEMPANLLPDVSFRRRLLNHSVQAMDALDNFSSLDHVLSKEQPLDKGNPDFIKFNRERIRQSFERSKSSTVATKMVVSSVVDYTDAVPYTLHEALLNHWIYFSQKDQYTAVLSVVNPRTGDTFKINAKNAYMYFLYAFAKSIGITLTKLPQLYVRRVIRTPTPTVDDLMSVVDFKYVTPEDAEFVRGMQPAIPGMTTAALFQSTVEAIHYASWKQGNFIANQEHEYTRGLVHAMVARLYSNEYLDTEDAGKDFPVWLAENRLDADGMSDENWHELMLNIYREATGYKMNVTESVSELQKAMVRMFAQLSSYSIQFITDINKTSVKVVNWAAIRVGDMKGGGKLFYEIHLTILKILRQQFNINAKYWIELTGLDVEIIGALNGPDLGLLDLEFGVSKSKRKQRMGIMNLGSQSLVDPYNTLENAGRENMPLYAFWNNLTALEKTEYAQFFDHCHKEPFYPTQVDMDDLVLNANLPGFEYQQVTQRYLNAFNYFYVPKFSYKFLDLNTETELDGFYNNYGDTQAAAISFNGGNLMVEGVNYMSHVPVDATIGSAYSSGGWQFVNRFDPVLGTDTETDAGTLAWLDGESEVSFTAQYSETQANGLSNSLKSADQGLSAFKQVSTTVQPVTTYSNTIVQGLVPSTATYSFTLAKAVGTSTLAPLFSRYTEDTVTDNMVPESHVAQIAGLTNWLTKIEPATMKVFKDTTLPGMYFWIGNRSLELDNMVPRYSETRVNGLLRFSKVYTLANMTAWYSVKTISLTSWMLTPTQFSIGKGNHTAEFSLENTLSNVEISLEP